MAEFISKRIIKEADKSLEKGKQKYAAYFINTSLYKKWQEDVNSILDIEGYGDCIVTE